MNRADIKERCYGLTGSMGSGKSAVSDFMKKSFGQHHVDADLVCRDLLEVGQQGWKILNEKFGDIFFHKDGSLNREQLRKRIFEDGNFRDDLNSLLHPLVRVEINNRLIAEAAIHPEIKHIIEVPLLFEAGWQEDFHTVIVVYADRVRCAERIMGRDGIAMQDALKAIDSQFPISTKVSLADHVIDNNGTWQETCSQIIQLADALGISR
ncbi:MAG: dephospho-CoA kinase [Proteobacteria bacterium]|nr:dephospho-CoA kinase [Pseudomonadota bacterium]MBU1708727.1 dephospho-CoA kinase [Pseudomonadota bacterium]